MLKQVLLYLLLLAITGVVTTIAYFHFRSEWIIFHRAEHYFEKKEWDKAVPLYQEAIEKGIYNRVVVFHLGDSLISTKQFSQAASLYKKYLEIYPTDSTAQLRYARVLGYMGDFEAEERERRKLLEHGGLENEPAAH